MKTTFKILILFLISLTLISFLSYAMVMSLKSEITHGIERRALKLEDKDCYSWQEIEVIIFGETQE